MDRNYDNDHRVRAGREGSMFTEIDNNKMCGFINVITDDGEEETIEVPIRYEVCPACAGKGTHVNPSIDADVQCYGCQGWRVIPVLDEDKCDDKVLKRLNDAYQRRDDGYQRD